MSDLIEQVEKAQSEIRAEGHAGWGNLLDAVIEALRPVENAEVKTVLADLDDAETEFFNLNSEGYAADIRTGMNLIERLARELAGKESAVRRTLHENAELQSQLAEAKEQAGKWKDKALKWDDINKSLERQIESLQAQIATLKSEKEEWTQQLVHAASAENKLKAQIAEYDKLASKTLGDMSASEQISRSYLTKVSKEIDRIRQMGEK